MMGVRWAGGWHNRNGVRWKVCRVPRGVSRTGAAFEQSEMLDEVDSFCSPRKRVRKGTVEIKPWYRFFKNHIQSDLSGGTRYTSGLESTRSSNQTAKHVGLQKGSSVLISDEVNFSCFVLDL